MKQKKQSLRVCELLSVLIINTYKIVAVYKYFCMLDKSKSHPNLLEQRNFYC